MKLHALLLLAAASVCPTVCLADSVITFEGYAGGTAFTNQFAGVNFNGATVLSLTDGTLNPVFPPHSGSNVVYNPSGPMTLDFTTPVQYFEGYFTYNMPLVIDAYNAADTLVDVYNSVCTMNYTGAGTGCAPNEFGMVSGTDISSVVISGGGGNNFVLDDAEFTGSVGTTVTPEPSSLLLLGTGLMGTLGMMRRRLLS